MSDLFHERVSDAFILEVWKVMRATPRHQYQILTKRPERMGDIVRFKIADVLPNVWLGTSIVTLRMKLQRSFFPIFLGGDLSRKVK
jgi:protein gp37